MQLPCPKCGAATAGTFCKTCLPEIEPLVGKIKPSKLVGCCQCQKIRVAGTWKPFDLQLLGHSLTLTEHATAVEFEEPVLEWKPGIKKTVTVAAVVTGTHEGVPYEQTVTVPIKYEMTSCDKCKKLGTQYYEGTLQVRNETPAVKAALNRYLKEHQVHCTKTVTLPNGADYYLTDHRAVGHVARTLQKKFGGEMKVNAKHFSKDKQRSKTLYRTNAFLAIPEFTKGDVILHQDAYYQVLTVGVKIQAVNLITGEKEHFPYKLGDAHVLPTATTTVTNTAPVEVLHPRTFQPTTPENTLPVQLNQNVTVAIDGEKLFLHSRNP